jgi:hypothetical protein
MIVERQTNGRWPSGDMPRWSQRLTLGRAEPAPPRGPSPARMALRGKPGDNASGGFPGGMRSARPRCKAVLMPRPFITQDGCLGGREAMTTCLARAGPFLAGVRSPPLRGLDYPRAKWPCGASPGITREGVFSEGCAPRVRLAGPHECRGIPFSPDDEPTGRLAYRAHASVNRKPPCGRAEPAPPGVYNPKGDGLEGKAGN